MITGKELDTMQTDVESLKSIGLRTQAKDLGVITPASRRIYHSRTPRASITEVSQTRGSSSVINSYLGTAGQIVVNTDDNSIHVMDGITFGGHKTVSVSQVTELIALVEQLKCEVESLSFELKKVKAK